VRALRRIGRTGRAGRSGEAVTFFQEEDAGQLRAIANVMRAAGCEIPAWMLQLRRESASQRGKGADGTRGSAAGAQKARAPVSVRSAFESRQASRKEQIIRQSKVRRRSRVRVIILARRFLCPALLLSSATLAQEKKLRSVQRGGKPSVAPQSAAAQEHAV